EVRVRGRAGVARRRQRPLHAVALRDLRFDVEHGVAQRGGGDASGGTRDGGGRPAAVELARELALRYRVADAKRREPERLRQAADGDEVRRPLEVRDDRLTRVLVVSLVDDDERLGQVAGER